MEAIRRDKAWLCSNFLKDPPSHILASALACMDMHTGGRTVLKEFDYVIEAPDRTQDGRYIWFNSTWTGLMQVWRMEVDGSNPTHMAKEDDNCWFPHVSPDGQWVVYIAYGKDDMNPGDHPANAPHARPGRRVENDREAVWRTGYDQCEFVGSGQSHDCLCLLPA